MNPNTSTRAMARPRAMPRVIGWLAVAVAASALAACGRNDDGDSVGNKVDGAVAATEQRAADAKVAATDMTRDARTAVVNAGEKVGDKISDAVITTSVNAELAKDSGLSALKINVDTAAGRVALKGSAPNAAARERATSLALAVKGVISVDNQLTLEAGTM